MPLSTGLITRSPFLAGAAPHSPIPQAVPAPCLLRPALVERGEFSIGRRPGKSPRGRSYLLLILQVVQNTLQVRIKPTAWVALFVSSHP